MSTISPPSAYYATAVHAAVHGGHVRLFISMTYINRSGDYRMCTVVLRRVHRNSDVDVDTVAPSSLLTASPPNACSDSAFSTSVRSATSPQQSTR